MVNQVANVPQRQIMPQSKLLDNLPDLWEDLSANVSIGFPILGIKGGKWHYRFRGEESILLDAQGRFPTPAVQVVMIKAQKELSRTYYVNPYVEGVNKPPDCWSSDGVAPDVTVANPVSPVCATCPMDAWGSGASPSAPKAKACQQRRRVVVTPCMGEYPDLLNEAGGGPILLSVPPGSLANLVGYSNMLKDHRVQYIGVVTELSFTQDPSIAFPKIEFNYVRPLTDAEVEIVLGLRETEQVDRILNTKMVPEEMTAPGPAGSTASAQPSPPRAPAAAAQPRQAPRASVVRAPAPQTVPPAPPPPVQQAAPPPPPPPPPVAAAPPPPPPPTANRVGGFAMQRVGGAAPPPPPTAAPAGTIANAMQQPAAPPPSMRGVVKPLPPRQPEESEDGAQQDAAPEAAEPETTEGMIPTDFTNMFENLMKAG